MKKPEKKSNWIQGARFRIKNKKWLMYSSHIARRILAKIDEREDLSQAELARTLDISPQQVSKIVKGQENLTLETIGKLSDALGFELITFPDYEYSSTIYSDASSYQNKSTIVYEPIKFEGRLDKLIWQDFIDNTMKEKNASTSEVVTVTKWKEVIVDKIKNLENIPPAIRA
ncbi:MAG: helix-turn-helix transcriptional regulator [Chitinophagales bacterium]|nr:helix-turn-helix transcriptional regulator [Chitinophagales bacterium]